MNEIHWHFRRPSFLCSKHPLIRCPVTTTELQNHVNSRASGNIVRVQGLVVGKLLPRVDETDLVHLDALLFLQSLFDGQDLVFRLKIEGLFAASQSFDKNLRFTRVDAKIDASKVRCSSAFCNNSIANTARECSGTMTCIKLSTAAVGTLVAEGRGFRLARSFVLVI